MVWSYLAQWLRINLSPWFSVFVLSGSLPHFWKLSSLFQPLFNKYLSNTIIHPIGAAENKSNSLCIWNTYSDFMPLLASFSPKYGYPTSLDFRCYFLFLWNGFSGYLCEFRCKICISPSDITMFVFLLRLDIINSSSTMKIDSCPKLKSLSLIFLHWVPFL